MMPRLQTELRLPEDSRDIIPYITERLRERDGGQLAEDLIHFLRDYEGSGSSGGGALEERMTDLESRMSAQITELESRMSAQVAELTNQVTELRQHLDAGMQASAIRTIVPASENDPEAGMSRRIPLEVLLQAEELRRNGMTYTGIVKKLDLRWAASTLQSAMKRRRERYGLPD
jgi:uncharacterized coiled-coil protein SlyX